MSACHGVVSNKTKGSASPKAKAVAKVRIDLTKPYVTYGNKPLASPVLRRPKSRADIEYKLQKQECTFKPMFATKNYNRNKNRAKPVIQANLKSKSPKRAAKEPWKMEI